MVNPRTDINYGSTPPIPHGQPITGHQRATGRVSAQKLSVMAKRLGRCGDINTLTGHVCVTQPHDDEFEHMAVQIGGPDDGKVYSKWGGNKINPGNGHAHA
jgi:hypothetical protein